MVEGTKEWEIILYTDNDRKDHFSVLVHRVIVIVINNITNVDLNHFILQQGSMVSISNWPLWFLT